MAQSKEDFIGVPKTTAEDSDSSYGHHHHRRTKPKPKSKTTLNNIPGRGANLNHNSSSSDSSNANALSEASVRRSLRLLAYRWRLCRLYMKTQEPQKAATCFFTATEHAQVGT